jgi:hypothetical protein
MFSRKLEEATTPSFKPRIVSAGLFFACERTTSLTLAALKK